MSQDMALVALHREERHLLVKRSVTGDHRSLLNVFDHVPEREVGLWLAWCLHRNVDWSLRGELGGERLRMNHKRCSRNGSGVVLLWHEFLNVKGRVLLGHVRLKSNWVEILGHAWLLGLAVNEDFVVEIINGRGT
jgi:hypothetical protein